MPGGVARAQAALTVTVCGAGSAALAGTAMFEIARANSARAA
jgi:hypothetical protein